MANQTGGNKAVRETHGRMWRVVLCGLAGFALAIPAVAKDAGAGVDVRATIIAVHEVPAGNPLPGLHVDAKINGRTVDVYIAPMDFLVKNDIKLKKSEEVHIVGTVTKAGDEDVVLAREITTGTIDPKTREFNDNMTIYLRNNDGPLW
jgi:hypothetical protein